LVGCPSWRGAGAEQGVLTGAVGESVLQAPLYRRSRIVPALKARSNFRMACDRERNKRNAAYLLLLPGQLRCTSRRRGGPSQHYCYEPNRSSITCGEHRESCARPLCSERQRCWRGFRPGGPDSSRWLACNRKRNRMGLGHHAAGWQADQYRLLSTLPGFAMLPVSRLSVGVKYRG